MLSKTIPAFSPSEKFPQPGQQISRENATTIIDGVLGLVLGFRLLLVGDNVSLFPFPFGFLVGLLLGFWVGPALRLGLGLELRLGLVLGFRLLLVGDTVSLLPFPFGFLVGLLLGFAPLPPFVDLLGLFPLPPLLQMTRLLVLLNTRSSSSQLIDGAGLLLVGDNVSLFPFPFGILVGLIHEVGLVTT
jgi:hypothetical protein